MVIVFTDGAIVKLEPAVGGDGFIIGMQGEIDYLHDNKMTRPLMIARFWSGDKDLPGPSCFVEDDNEQD